MKIRAFQLLPVVGLLVAASDTRANAPAGRYTIPATGTVYDTKTKLTWQEPPAPGLYAWGAVSTADTAQNYCSKLTLNAKAWRLPTANELLSLVDRSVPPPGSTGGAAAKIDSIYFPSDDPEYFWSSTVLLNSGTPPTARYVDFGTGLSNYTSSNNAYSVRCVY